MPKITNAFDKNGTRTTKTHAITRNAVGRPLRARKYHNTAAPSKKKSIVTTSLKFKPTKKRKPLPPPNNVKRKETR
jgi:hypothetical protein